MRWQHQSFEQLGNADLYRLLQLRSRVFVVEQNCVFLDLDGNDMQAVHLFYGNAQETAAYVRILRTPDSPIAEAAIGRIVVAPEYRGRGLAAEALRLATDFVFREWQSDSIYLQAQSYLLPFYQNFGYEAVSGEYLEDGIPHVDMRLQRP
ncbi:MAG: GNAT family N-acetyltransferase [Neisseria sp.]|nr:GNAT family N-acetyltransferase [Neisseria sp.]